MAVIGVDFGNCNSFPCYIEGMNEKTRRGGQEHSLVPHDNRYNAGIPTVYFYSKKDGQDYFGVAAKRKNPIGNRRDLLKRRIDTTEVIDGKTIDYNQVITRMIEHIVNIANDTMRQEHGITTNEICLAHPITIPQHQWRRLKELAEQGKIADGRKIRVVGSIAEPAGAALAYLAAQNAEEYNNSTVMVYDLGGGTFDIANVSAHLDGVQRNGAVEYYDIMEIDGIEKGVGGHEFDEAMVNLIKSKAPDAIWAPGQLESTAEEKKIELSDATSVEVMVIRRDTGDVDTITITRKEYEDTVSSMVDRTIALFKEVYARAHIKPQMILLTGGQSQMPLIERQMAAAFPEFARDHRIRRYKSSTAIAVGAARYGAFVGNSVPVIKRNTYCFGVGNIRDAMKRIHVDILIPEESMIPTPANKWHRYWTNTPRSRDTSVIMEGKKKKPDIYDDADFNRRLELVIDFGREMPENTLVEICIWLDENDILQGRAKMADSQEIIEGHIKIVDLH